MKTKNIILTLGFFGMLNISSQARLGETSEQLNKRYGDHLLAHKKGVLSYRLYEFSGKKIRVMFLEDESVLEMIISGPEFVYSPEQGAEIGARSMKFIRGMLMQAYGFTEEEIVELANMKRTNRDVVESSIQKNNTLVNYNIIQNMEENSVKITAMIMDIAAHKERSKELGFGQFMSDCVDLESRKEDAAEAEGF